MNTRDHYHHLRQHRDNLPPWCPICRRTANGDLVPLRHVEAGPVYLRDGSELIRLSSERLTRVEETSTRTAEVDIPIGPDLIEHRHTDHVIDGDQVERRHWRTRLRPRRTPAPINDDVEAEERPRTLLPIDATIMRRLAAAARRSTDPGE